MNIQTMQMSWTDKLLMGVLAVLLFVVGLFTSLLAFAVGGAMALVVGAKLWWARRQLESDFIEAEYQVQQEELT